MADGQYSDRGLVRRLVQHTQPCWGGIVGLLALGLISTPIALLSPLPLRIAVDSAIGSAPLPRWLQPLLPSAIPRSAAGVLGLAGGLVLILALLTQVQELAAGVLRTSISERLILHFRT